tara:strand:+ start:481 stop:639 length:159 start_codon:yes stop_codon:yes gene_type:complete
MSTEKPYSAGSIQKLKSAGYKQGRQGSFGYDIIKRGNNKIIQIHGKLFPKLD